MKPNIVFLVIDSLRADKIYGEEKVSGTPNIDYLIKQGAYFTNAMTTNQYTAQVIQSIFSSRFPLRKMKKKLYQKSDSTITPFSQLKNIGYNTFATIQEDIILHGFTETFDNDDVTFPSEENLYNGLAEKILKKFDSFNDPWFYYIHLSDLHKPCEVPEKLKHLNLPERYDQNLIEVDSLIGKILSKISLDETLVIITSDHGDYISSVIGARGESVNTKVKLKNSIKKFIPKKMSSKIHLQKQKTIEKIHANLAKTPHEKRNIDSHKMTLNNNLFDDIIHVPLIFSGYKIKPSLLVSQQICNIDIFPTILNLLEIQTTGLKIDGRSLVPLLEGKKFDSYPIYITSMANMKKLYMTIRIPDESLGPLIGIRTENFKYFRNFLDPKKDIHLYDIINDPFEDVNICKNNQNKIDEMEILINKIQKNCFPLLDNDEEISDAQINKVQNSLKKLGYI